MLSKEKIDSYIKDLNTRSFYKEYNYNCNPDKLLKISKRGINLYEPLNSYKFNHHPNYVEISFITLTKILIYNINQYIRYKILFNHESLFQKKVNYKNLFDPKIRDLLIEKYNENAFNYKNGILVVNKIFLDFFVKYNLFRRYLIYAYSNEKYLMFIDKLKTNNFISNKIDLLYNFSSADFFQYYCQVFSGLNIYNDYFYLNRNIILIDEYNLINERLLNDIYPYINQIVYKKLIRINNFFDNEKRKRGRYITYKLKKIVNSDYIISKIFESPYYLSYLIYNLKINRIVEGTALQIIYLISLIHNKVNINIINALIFSDTNSFVVLERYLFCKTYNNNVKLLFKIHNNSLPTDKLINDLFYNSESKLLKQYIYFE